MPTKSRPLLASGLLVLIIPSAVFGIVIRHDVPDSRYRVSDNYFPPLADLPVEGHAVLISPCWLVTAAHAVTWQKTPISEVSIVGRQRAVKRLVVHPLYHRPPQAGRGDAAPLMKFLLKDPDIALIELAAPVRDVRPALPYRDGSENGKIAEIIGKGVSGNGLIGEQPGGSHRTFLRRAFNRITSAKGRWITYRFDRGSNALPLEGMQASGDSGGPLLIKDHGQWKLAGLTSWKFVQGDLANFRPETYGQVNYDVRVAFYRKWINSVISSEPLCT
ncbi:MAG TPA: trypsin-like serine protease [Sphingomicrobium sp.]|nr:trypsin-like serine protease [Sphingomicrobium sp.]